jgi:hypothetical protein
MAISKEDQKTLDTPVTVPVYYYEDSDGVTIDTDAMRAVLEEMIEHLEEITICKCGFCGDTLEEDTTYCSKECSKADNTERV